MDDIEHTRSKARDAVKIYEYNINFTRKNDFLITFDIANDVCDHIIKNVNEYSYCLNNGCFYPLHKNSLNKPSEFYLVFYNTNICNMFKKEMEIRGFYCFLDNRTSTIFITNLVDSKDLSQDKCLVDKCIVS